jgi:hypothetical protein
VFIVLCMELEIMDWVVGGWALVLGARHMKAPHYHVDHGRISRQDSGTILHGAMVQGTGDRRMRRRGGTSNIRH